MTFAFYAGMQNKVQHMNYSYVCFKPIYYNKALFETKNTNHEIDSHLDKKLNYVTSKIFFHTDSKVIVFFEVD